ncbi:Mov34/MPN/PAD-1 family protein [Microbulbifer sp. ANSA005]|uniref:Mov34/MPN/PAD-1 family protein n=1 Tax=Microbulbifer sp. ANSA005 TaxID=3243362 RepID=UPI004041D8CA
MATEYFEWGTPVAEADNEAIPEALKAFRDVCEEHSACEVQGYCKDVALGNFMVTLEIGDGTFEINNTAGILRVELIAVVYTPNSNSHWEVRPLRRDFPVTIHQNHVLEGEPRSLCLYIENWKSVERSWTPQSFLGRILWWLRSTAEGTIHEDDQPIEQLFFNSSTTILLPRDHFEKTENLEYHLVFTSYQPNGSSRSTLRGQYVPASNIDEQKTSACIPISLILDPIENGPVEQYPTSLGRLQDMVTDRGADILEPLKSMIRKRVGSTGLTGQESSKAQFVLVILGIPRCRNGKVEKTELLGFAINTTLSKLGESLGTLFESPTDKKWYVDTSIGQSNTSESEKWRELRLELVQVQLFPSQENIRLYSGLSATEPGPTGVIAGLGALGSTMAHLWAREAWGNWHFIDDDILQVHNVARHIATHRAIGLAKTHISRLIIDDLFEQPKSSTDRDYIGSITDDTPELLNILKNAEILVDVTTTLYVPRELAERNDVPRVASVFFTPSGSASILLLEDKQRTIRSSHLEAQYYRAILTSNWGRTHLDGHHGQFWVGAGCRDASVAISNELVQLHGATLARQLRKTTSSPQAKICVWDYDDQSGAITPYDIPVARVQTVSIAGWKIVWDLDFEESIQTERRNQLPNETGGMLLGIVDQKTKIIALVSWVGQPPNSIASPSSFLRGSEGQEEIINETQRRTAGIVSYVGEWHSHPPNVTASPSCDDKKQLASITDEFTTSSTIPIMLIVAEGSIGFCMQREYVLIRNQLKNTEQ